MGNVATFQLVVPAIPPAFDPSLDNTFGDFPAPRSAGPTVYIFDGVMRAEHDQELVITKNPVQTGASLTDYAYLLPARLSIEVAMSDAMQSYKAGLFAGSGGRSVEAYRALLAIQAAKVPLTISTRLRTYDHMLIAAVRPEEHDGTLYSLKCTVVFEQVLIATADVSFAPYDLATNYPFQDQSARPQVTFQASSGTTNPEPVPQAVRDQHATPGPWANAYQAPPGAGTWSSTSAVHPKLIGP